MITGKRRKADVREVDGMRTDRDVEKLVSRMDMKNGAKRVVVQYGKGLLAGTHIAYVSVARKMLHQGKSVAEVKRFLADLTDAAELASIMKDAQGRA